MKNVNWQKKYDKTLFASLLVFGQILYFVAFIMRDVADQERTLSATYYLPSLGMGPRKIMNDLIVYHYAILTSPDPNFSSYTSFVKDSIQDWLRTFDPLTFIVGFGILLSWGVFYGLFSRHRQLEHMLAGFKRKEVAYQHALLDQKMILLRTQINPHFLSNTMSVIGAYVLERTPLQAYQYLQGLSKLMREILEKATEPYLTLKDEVRFLGTFLQNLALVLPEDKLNWHIQVDSQLDLTQTLIPTMILQPLVENAVEHGIRPKEGKGQVTISFTKVTGGLVCAVEDNGVGRRSKQKTRKSGHHSMALDITQQRLRLMSEEKVPAYELKTIDLINSQGEAQGTRVEVKLPLITVDQRSHRK